MRAHIHTYTRTHAHTSPQEFICPTCCCLPQALDMPRLLWALAPSPADLAQEPDVHAIVAPMLREGSASPATVVWACVVRMCLVMVVVWRYNNSYCKLSPMYITLVNPIRIDPNVCAWRASRRISCPRDKRRCRHFWSWRGSARERCCCASTHTRTRCARPLQRRAHTPIWWGEHVRTEPVNSRHRLSSCYTASLPSCMCTLHVHVC